MTASDKAKPSETTSLVSPSKQVSLIFSIRTFSLERIQLYNISDSKLCTQNISTMYVLMVCIAHKPIIFIFLHRIDFWL